jgi:WD40 repeat protein/tRNA A-37 threonylcarbamoyl transferase component Bud32
MTQQDIFTAALLITDPEGRAAYLAQACGGDAELRRRVETLLRTHEGAGDFLARPAVEQLAGDPSPRPARQQGVPQPEGAAEDEVLDFLQPTGTPGALGRLDHYEILDVVGKGGMGVVLRARDTKLLRVVALKVLAAPLAASGTARQRFVREARAAAAVRDEHVIDIHAVRDDGPAPYLVMEFIDGCNLEALVRRNGPLEVKEVLRIGTQIASGLAAAHRQGLVHRDVKPANILLENGVQRVKLTDFGLARAVDDASLTHSGLIAGTPTYMSPEQANGEPIDHRSDLFSLGSVLYEMCTGRPAFRAPNTAAVLRRINDETPRPIRAVNPDVPEPLCRVLDRLHAKKPADRPASASEVADLLAGLLADLNFGRSGEPSGAPVLQRPPQLPGPARRPWLWAAAALVLLVAGLGVGEATGVTDVRGTVIRLFSPEGTLIVEVDDPRFSVTVDGADVVISGTGAREIRLKPGQYQVEASKDGKVVRRELVTVTRNGRQVVRISHEAAPLTEAALPAPKFKGALLGHAEAVNSVAYSPNGELLASGDQAGEVRVWDVPAGTLRYVLPALGSSVQALAFSPDGKSLLTAAVQGDGDINVWGAKTGKPDGALKGHTKGLFEVSFGPDGKALASAGWDATVRVWDFAARRELRAIPSPGGQWVRSAVVSAGGQIGVGSEDKVFLLGLDGRLVKTFDTASGPLCFSPDGRLLAGTTWGEGRVTVWDVKTGEKVGAWRAHEAPVNGVAFWPGGGALATAGHDGAVRLWDVATQRKLAEVRHDGQAHHLAFSPDGGALATTGAEDRLVKLWDVSFLRALKAPEKSK